MNIVRLIPRLVVALLLAAPAAVAAPGFAPLDGPAIALLVNGNCNAIAQQVAAQYGGKGRGTVQNRGGQRVCVVVVVVQGQNGQRAQRIEQVVPMN